MNNSIAELEARINELEQENQLLKQQQIDINRAKELYLKIFEEFPALIWRSGLNKLCDYFNKTWLDFTGRTMEQENGNGWAEGVHPDDFDFCLDIYVTNFDKRLPFLMEYRLKNKQGEYRWIRDFGRPFYDLDNTFLGYIGSCYDITEIKDNEIKLQELNAAKDKFFSIIAHDLKNPFGNLLILSDLLQKCINYNDYSKIEFYIQELSGSTKNIYNLLENLLDWSRSQLNHIEFNPQCISLEKICMGVIENLQYYATVKGIQIKYFTSDIEDLFADKNMIETILRNLISNAIKFSVPNSVIRIFAERKNEEVIITVLDNGIGISKSQIQNLFNLKTVKSTPGTANEKGTGLGLVLCREFVEKHNGTIWVESEPGKGSEFKFTIPVLQVA